MGLGVIKDLWVWFSVVLGLCVKIFDSCYLFLVSSRIDVGPLDCDRCGKDRMYPPEPKSLTEAAGLSGDAGVKLHRQEALCHECKGLGDEARGAVWAGSLRGSD
jgi:hypothetical protein